MAVHPKTDAPCMNTKTARTILLCMNSNICLAEIKAHPRHISLIQG